MEMTESLPQGIHEKLLAMSEEGNRLLEAGRLDRALDKFQEAWELLPEPRHHWEAACWIQAAIGDAHWHAKRYHEAELAFRTAALCPGGMGNPFIHLRLGQCAFELGHHREAKDELTRAYMGAGKEIFQEDPKYLELLKDTLLPPAGSESL